jgi:digeranylgeranylglycerophospholipid reductase
MVGRWAGLNTRTKLREMTSDVQFELVGVELAQEDVMEFYFGSEIAPGGYAWVFPKGDGVANVGLGVRGASRPAFEYLRDFVDSMPGLRNAEVVGIVAGGVPLQGPLEKTVGDGVLLVGDAARQVDPLTGGGIYNAMHCGVIAGETLLRAVAEEDFSEAVLMEYDREWRAQVGATLIQSLQVKKILEKMTDTDLNTAARLMKDVKLMDFNLKGTGSLMQGMPVDIVQFVQSLLLKN